MIDSDWIPIRLTDKQAEFLSLTTREAFYGGQAGGGKSDAVLAGAALNVDKPKYNAIIFRRTYPELSQPDGLIARSHEWFGPTPAKWSEQKLRWTFPSGATIRFAHMQRETDVHDYQGGQYQYVGWDELTHFTKFQYTYMFSRQRRNPDLDVPLLMRGASNPGGEGHQWVYERFVQPDPYGEGVGERPFISAALADNPHISREEYIAGMDELDPITKAQLLQGLWIVDKSLRPFTRDWFRGPKTFSFGERYAHVDLDILGRNRYDHDSYYLRNLVKYRWLSYDTAFKDKDVNDKTGMCVFEMLPNYLILLRYADAEHLDVPGVQDRIERDFKKWNQDGKLRGIIIEDKASGIGVLQTLRKMNEEIAPYLIPFNPKQESKEFRARQVAPWLEKDVLLLPAPGMSVPWLQWFEDALFDFPYTNDKDVIDALTQFLLYSEHRIANGWRARTGRVQQAQKEQAIHELEESAV